MREVVEEHTGGAPCLFLQGASGELGPAHQYVGDPAVADQHGRRLGFSALSALEGMLPPGQALRYDGVVESGAPLAVWLPGAVRALAACSTAASSTCRCRSSRCRRSRSSRRSAPPPTTAR